MVVVRRKGVCVAVSHWLLLVMVIGHCCCWLVLVMVVMAGHTCDCSHHTTSCEHCTFPWPRAPPPALSLLVGLRKHPLHNPRHWSLGHMVGQGMVGHFEVAQ